MNVTTADGAREGAEPTVAPQRRDASSRVSLADEDAVRGVVTETLFGLWSAVNELSRLRPSRRERYRVTVFGSARAVPGHFVYEEVKRMAAALSAMGCDIVTGGGPGLMQAANEGAREAAAPERAESIGIRIALPFEQGANPFVEQLYTHGTFFTRLHQFALMSDAYLVAPGGIGTLLEATMVWQLLQVRHLHETPLVFVGPMWTGLVDWVAEQMRRPGFELAGADDVRIPHCVADSDEAIAVIREDQARWRAAQGSGA